MKTNQFATALDFHLLVISLLRNNRSFNCRMRAIEWRLDHVGPEAQSALPKFSVYETFQDVLNIKVCVPLKALL